MDDYKGFKRFSYNISQKADALAIRFLVFLVSFLVLFIIIFTLFNDNDKTRNAGVYGMSVLLVSLNKFDVNLLYIDADSKKTPFISGDYKALLPLKKGIEHVQFMMVVSAGLSLLFGVVICLLFIRYFSGHQHNKNNKKTRLRGAELMKADTFLKIINEERLGSPYPLGNIPWLLDKVRRHLYLSGDTGVGKSQALMDILEVVRERKEKAFLLDKNGELLSHFYNPETDYILGPFDDRSENWTPFLEGIEEVDFERIAKSFIPSGNGGKDDHWPEASVTVFTALLYQVSHTGGV